MRAGKADEPTMHGPSMVTNKGFANKLPFASKHYTADNADRLFVESLRILKEKGFSVPEK